MSYISIPEYTIATDFSEDETNQVSGRSSVRTANLDTEHTNIKAALDALTNDLLLIQRTDGKVKDAVVEPHTFSAAALILIASTFTPRGAWATATAYAVGDIVSNGGAGYLCTVAHTSGTFSTDLAAEKWNIIANTDTTYSGFSFDSDTTKNKLVDNNTMNLFETLRTLLTTRGDILVRDASGNARLALGSAGQFPASDGTDLAYREIMARLEKTGAYTVVRADGNKVIDVDASAATRTITLPDISAGDVANGWPIWVRALDATNQITIVRAGSTDTFAINGATSLTLNRAGECVCLVADSDNDKWILASDNRHVGASIGRHSNQSVSTATWTKVQCNVLNRDPQGITDISTNFRITVKEAGVYRVRIQMGNSGSLTDGKIFSIEARINGSSPAETKRIMSRIIIAATSTITLNATGEITLAANDYVELWTYHDQGSNVDLGLNAVVEISKVR